MTRLLTLITLLLLLVGCADPDVTRTACSIVDINTANGPELETLPGIGPVLAQNIMAYIAANGPFTSIEDLANVEGIGEAALDRLRPCISIGTGQ